MTDRLGVDAFKLTHRGRRRPHNEDWVDYHEPENPAELTSSGSLYVVADGVGGAARGELASRYAVQKVLYEFYRSSDPDLGERLRAAVQAANADIFNHAERIELPDPMGTTLVATALRGREAVVVNVGDSRAYLIRAGQVDQISRDHSDVERLLSGGEITLEEALTFPHTNRIFRSVGAEAHVEVDVYRREVVTGDTLLLCSDGLHKYFPDTREVRRLAKDGLLEQHAERLVSSGNAELVRLATTGTPEEAARPSPSRRPRA